LVAALERFVSRNTPHAATWVLTLLAAVLIGMAGLLMLNARLFKASIDQVVQQTFAVFMQDISANLDLMGVSDMSPHCSTVAQQSLEKTQAKIGQTLRISIVDQGKIWCDSDRTTIGNARPSDWPQAQTSAQGMTLFDTAMASGGVLAWNSGRQTMDLVVLVTPFKNDNDNRLVLWSLTWQTSMAVVVLLLLITLVALALHLHMSQVFAPELRALRAIQSHPKRNSEWPSLEKDLPALAQQAMLEMDHAQEKMNAKLGAH
jgi:hypothetical protein